MLKLSNAISHTTVNHPIWVTVAHTHKARRQNEQNISVNSIHQKIKTVSVPILNTAIHHDHCGGGGGQTGSRRNGWLISSLQGWRQALIELFNDVLGKVELG